MSDRDAALVFDRIVHANMARATMGISPISLTLAYVDWALHLAISPGKCLKLAEHAIAEWMQCISKMSQAYVDPSVEISVESSVQDKRFQNEAWQRWPYNWYARAFSCQQQWWHDATTDIRGVSAHHQHVMSFIVRQQLDMLSPANFIATHPLVLRATINECGQNLWRGLSHFHEDQEAARRGNRAVGTDAFKLGDALAATPGVIVFRNCLMELIQYVPTTPQVDAEPILIVPAWIMKYYILDLSHDNSLVRYLVDQGHTVFMISWHNPDATDRDVGMDDYLQHGILDALSVIQIIMPDCKIHLVGYCLGGTLLAIAAAYLARNAQSVVHSLTLLAAQTDFTEAGELTLFIDESQLHYLEDMMWDQGYLDTTQMAGTFQLLQSNELIWSKMVTQYLMGQRSPMFDLMAWNADATRLPYRMHSEYLSRMFLNNDLFEGRYQVNGQAIALSDIRVPIFMVATEKDHVAPWRSVYKINLVADTDVAFVLTSGGHNAGIVSEPGHVGRHFRYAIADREEKYIDPESWLKETPIKEGSWWPVWGDWLSGQAKAHVAPPAMGAVDKGYPLLDAAPGLYVLEA